MTIQSIMMKKRREQGLYVKVSIDGYEMNYYPPTPARKADILRRAGNTDNCEVLES